MNHFRFLPLAMLCLFSIAMSAQNKQSVSQQKISAVGKYAGYSTKEYKGYSASSLYLTMRDSTKIATDLYLPKKLEAGKKIPTILYLTRYVRSLRAKFPFSLIKDPISVLPPLEEIDYFTSYGYAVVVIDVRGSGASSGRRTMEFSPEEVKDGAEVVNWIIGQEWSNGKVGSTGVSYLGTTAELLLVNQHPAVKACIPRSNIFDLYNHIMFPGGVRHGPFVKVWGETTTHLDHNEFDSFGKQAKRLVKGTHKIDTDKGGKIYMTSLSEHTNNFDVYKGLQGIEFRDDVHPELSASSNEYSIHNNIKAIANSGTAIYRIGGWYDGALQRSVTEGIINTPNTVKALIGPWDHGPQDNASPWAKENVVDIDIHQEMLRFFDHYLKDIDNGIDKETPFYYYTVAAEHWDSTSTWPLPSASNQPYYFSAEKKLQSQTPSNENSFVHYTVDYTCTTDSTSRWNSMTPAYRHGHTKYGDRAAEGKKSVSFTSSVLVSDMTITGSAMLDLYVKADAKDAYIFAYLEDVSPDGKVIYVTEGQFRAINRKVSTNSDGYKTVGPFHSYQRKDTLPLVPGQVAQVSFELLPISYQFKQGHQVRITLAGADAQHFDLVGDLPKNWEIACTPTYPSAIVLPIVHKQ
ncbi:MAG: CocE/NonD family hydrolase [Chitinophagales bacterium]|nr:CocE/NonD family hydrolase [Chitinophagales bacterium]